MTYIAPQTFREWHPIGIYKSINKKTPFNFQLGTLPLILWFSSIDNKPISLINSCNHLGNSLNNAKIKDNCLICPFHNNKYNETDNFGSIAIQNNLIWWSYKSYQKKPFMPIKLNNANNFQIDINIDLITFILNLLASIKPDKYYWNMKKKQLFIKNKTTKIVYKNPYRIIIKSFDLIYEISILPLSFTKLRLFITYYNPLILPILYMMIIKEKIKYEFDITTNNLNIKNYFMFKKSNNNYLEKVYKSYENYMFLNDYTVNQFMINKNYY
jgi:nitrite reductase/ring-hydroxylating ferredoxin subunit